MNPIDALNHARDFLKTGEQFLEIDLLRARRDFSVAWGIGRVLKNYDLMVEARLALESTGLGGQREDNFDRDLTDHDWEDLFVYQQIGYGSAKQTILGNS